MKSPILTLLLLSGCVSAATAEDLSTEWYSEVGAAQAEARASDRYILVDLYADWCGWCRKLERNVFSDPAFIDFAKSFVKLRVDVEDGGEGGELQARYPVGGSLPTLLILSPRMALAGSVEGYAPRDAYLRRISEVIRRYRQDIETFDQILEHGRPGVLRQLAEDLYQRQDGARAARAYRRLLKDPQADPGDRAWDLYLLADALRMDFDFEGAAETLAQGKRRARRSGDFPLVEAYDLLQIRLAQDRGGCAELVAALERFLSDHPESRHRRTARRSLEKLSRSSDPTCT